MFLVYRKRKDGSHWHFNTHCSNWPQINFIQVRVVELAEGERLCDECAKLEARMFPSKG